MRKISIVLAVIMFMAGMSCASEVPANPFSGFGVVTRYRVNSNVKLNADGVPDYSGVNTYNAEDFYFGGYLKPGSDRSSLPVGTLTVISGDYAGQHYQLTPGGMINDSSFVAYGALYADIFTVGRKIMWNLLTSPDVITGAFEFPKNLSSASVKIGKNEIVPCVIYSPADDSSGMAKFDVTFVKSGDFSAPVAVDFDYVRINDYEVDDFRMPYPVKHRITRFVWLGQSISVTYGKGSCEYTWYFEIPDSVIEWEKLSLSGQPLTLKEGTSEEITIKIPSMYQLEKIFASSDINDLLGTGNDSVAVVDEGSVSFTQGKGWTSSDSEDKSSLSFRILAKSPGRTTLSIKIPHDRTYYREINVTDESGNMNLKESPMTLTPEITHITEAMIVEGRPYYPSVSDRGIEIGELGGFTGATESKRTVRNASGDIVEETYYTGPQGFVGINTEYFNTIQPAYLDSSNGSMYYLAYEGVTYSTKIAGLYGGEYASSSLRFYDSRDLEGISMWLEFPESPDMNVSSVSMSSLVSFDKIRTTEKQMKDFVPFFQLQREPGNLNKATSLEWSFVNPSTMKAVKPSGITDLTINDHSVTGTSGTIPLTGEYYDVSYINVYISYKYNGITYKWSFSPSYSYGDIRILEVKPGETKHVNYQHIFNASSCEIVIWDNDIVSADPVKISASGSPFEVSFDIRGLKEGTTSLSLVYNTGYSYRVVRGNVYVVSSSAVEKANDMSTDFFVHLLDEPVIEGKPYNSEGYFTQFGLLLTRKDLMTREEFDSNINDLFGTYSYSYSYHDPETGTDSTHNMNGSLNPDFVDSFLSGDTEYGTIRYKVIGDFQIGGVISWDIPSDLCKNGNTKFPELDTKAGQEITPRIVINRDGLNANSIEWYFTDANDKRVTSPANVKIDVNNERGNAITGEGNSGSTEINLPEVFIDNVTLTYEINGVKYEKIFNPVDMPKIYYYLGNNSGTFTWNSNTGELPLMLKKGETKELTLTVSGDFVNPKPFIGNPEVASLSVLSSTDKTVNVKITALKSGMTTIGMSCQRRGTYITYEYPESATEPVPVEHEYFYVNQVLYPREIWVAELDSSTNKYVIPRLTADAEELMSLLKTGGGSSWKDYSKSDTSGGTTGGETIITEPKYDESVKDTGYKGLSVYPRFAMPKDPSEDAYNAMWDFVDNLGLPYGVEMFSDYNMEVIASRDAVKVWEAVKDDLLSNDIPQLAAIILPEIHISRTAFYVFRLPADNITGNNQAVFWKHGLSDDKRYYTVPEELSRDIFIDDSGNPSGAVSGDKYITVGAYLTYGDYRPMVTAEATSRDIEILKGIEPVKPVTSPDVTPTTSTSPDVTPTTHTSPDVTPTTSTSPDVPPVVNPDTTRGGSVIPSKPAINVEEAAPLLRNILGRSDAPVAELPSSSLGTARVSADLPAGQLTAIRTQGREPVAVLPEISVETAAIYVMGVSLDALNVGDPIFLDMTMTPKTATDSVKTSENYDGDYTFLDDSGEEVSTVPAKKHVNLAAYLEPNYVYSPVITRSVTSTGGQMAVSSSSGGCSAGISFAGLILLAGLAITKLRK